MSIEVWDENGLDVSPSLFSIYFSAPLSLKVRLECGGPFLVTDKVLGHSKVSTTLQLST